MATLKSKKQKTKDILPILFELYPDATCSLDYKNAFELTIATSLAAQCTDLRVNIVTKDLFARYPTPADLATADIFEVEEYIRTTGFFRNKAKNIVACSQRLVEVYGGEVPDNMEQLITLPGVGRKTANVVLAHIFNVPSVIVDTHCIRLSNRLGLTKNKEPEVIEQELMKCTEKKYWTDLCNRFVFHGRAVCDARKPKCDICDLREFCDWGNGK